MDCTDIAALQDNPHVRLNILRQEWVLVSPHRTKRPWSGQVERLAEQQLPEHDPGNPLCPRSMRNGIPNPDYQSTYCFDNDFPAMLPAATGSKPEDTMSSGMQQSALLVARPISGQCRVVCFSPKLNLSLPLMTTEEIGKVIDTWIEETGRLAADYEWVQCFENKGSAMGCSNPHPHGQIWASDFLPNEPRLEDRSQRQYLTDKRSVMLADYVNLELEQHRREPDNGRVVVDNEHWVVVVPFWATWPFETLLLPKDATVRRILDISSEQKQTLAAIMKSLTIKYDNLFETSFPYSMGFHGAPTGRLMGEDQSHWLFHAHYYPPLLRSATVKKFMVGFELLAQVQRDLTPEMAAKKLRDLSGDVHYKQKQSLQ